MNKLKNKILEAYQNFDNKGLEVNCAEVFFEKSKMLINFYNDPNRVEPKIWSMNYAGCVEVEGLDELDDFVNPTWIDF